MALVKQRTARDYVWIALFAVSAVICWRLTIPSVCPYEGGAADDVFQRFREATAYINKTYSRGVYPLINCPDTFRIGGPNWERSKEHSMDVIGTTCEPWMTRPVATLLHELLLPGRAKALEWSSGSSTAWLLLGHAQYLVSVEHDEAWVNMQRQKMDSIFGSAYLADHWQLHFIPPNTAITVDPTENPERFAKYVSVEFLDKDQLGSFDFISIDGRARVACFDRALELLKPHGGILVLDNAERKSYQPGIAKVPRHWLRYDGVTSVDTTIVWISCRLGHC